MVVEVVGDGVRVGDAVVDPVGVVLGLAGAVAPPLSAGVMTGAVPDADGVLDAELPTESVDVGVVDVEADSDGVPEPLSEAAVGVCEGVAAAVPVGETVALPVPVPDGVGGDDAVVVNDSVGETVPVRE